MTRADLKHSGRMPDAREELNRSMREGRMESRHSINSLEGTDSSWKGLISFASFYHTIPNFVKCAP